MVEVNVPSTFLVGCPWLVTPAADNKLQLCKAKAMIVSSAKYFKYLIIGICDLCKKDRVFEVITLLDDACKKFGIKKPRIAVAGLNPHAGENQLFGDEEVDEIIPAIEEAVKLGYHVEGPFPPDTMFVKAVQGKFDGCIAMYHDQGHIPFKLEGFKWDNEKETMKSVKGVNITLGLPIIRTSVDHGTAFEIAGQGIASADAMLVAIDYAIIMSKHKN